MADPNYSCVNMTAPAVAYYVPHAVDSHQYSFGLKSLFADDPQADIPLVDAYLVETGKVLMA